MTDALTRANALTNASHRAAREAVLEVYGPDRYEEWVRAWARRSADLQYEVLQLAATADEIEALP